MAAQNDQPNVSLPPHRCHCDHSAIADPMIISKSEAKTQFTFARQVEVADFGFRPSYISSFAGLTDAERHSPTGRALLRALHVMRC
jgi:hypothetical protein